MEDAMIVAVHHRNTKNIGDLVCSPCNYFDFGDVEYVDVSGAIPPKGKYIFGGGAMFKRTVNAQVPGTKIAWGVGQTNRGMRETKGVVPPGFALFGSRDVGQNGAEWTPCASCMSPLLDQHYEVEHPVVVYLNAGVPNRLRVFGAPLLSNETSLQAALEFIGSGEVCVTNSYHGAYWATLMGRKAVIANPYSSKFFGYKHQPATTVDGDWRAVKPVAYPEALEECRQATRSFFNKVRDALC